VRLSDVAKTVRDRAAALAQKFPEGLTYAVPYDTTRFVEVSITEVVKTLAEAMLLVFLVVYLFLQSWRAAVIPFIAVPVSLIGTFAGLCALGYSINTLTLFGMVLAIGIVVDDAIVVLENVEQIATEVLPPDFSFDWGGTSYQEKRSGGASGFALGLAVIMVFLILSAQYERWSLPLSVLLALPFGTFGALAAVWLRGLTNDVYFQIGLVTLLGLAAKNAILIVEFALLKHEEGLSTSAAAIEAARLRFRPILMTSLAFIFGVLPLAISTGAGTGPFAAIRPRRRTCVSRFSLSFSRRCALARHGRRASLRSAPGTTMASGSRCRTSSTSGASIAAGHWPPPTTFSRPGTTARRSASPSQPTSPRRISDCAPPTRSPWCSRTRRSPGPTPWRCSATASKVASSANTICARPKPSCRPSSPTSRDARLSIVDFAKSLGGGWEPETFAVAH
jgi:hypothetical protein